MTKEQIDIINQSINNIKTLCKSMLCCTECPMNINFNAFPSEWENVSYDKEDLTEENIEN